MPLPTKRLVSSRVRGGRFAAVSVCLEIQEDGHEADVALICGDEKVGHRSDLALVAQLEEVLDEIQPDSVVLVGDGAEDEYIYPIISSRAHVDSVRKVYVKQSPGIEGSFYIITKMLSDPGKRKRFLVPLGFIIVLLSLFFIMPSLLVYSSDHDINTLASMSGSLAFFFVGVVLILYGYNVSELYQEFRKNLLSSLAGDTTRLLFLCVSLSIVLLMAVWNYVEVNGLYITSVFQWILYYFTSLVWPIVIAIMVYVVGQIIQDYQTSRTVKLSLVFGCIGIVNLGLVLTGVLDLISHFVWDDGFFQLGVIEIVAGVIISILSTYVKGRYIPAAPKEARPDEVF